MKMQENMQGWTGIGPEKRGRDLTRLGLIDKIEDLKHNVDIATDAGP